MKHSTIAIIGAGNVGSTLAYALLIKNITAEILLIDIDEKRCHGEILDLSDAFAFDRGSKIRSANAHDAAQADIIVIAAGKAQMHDQSRLELLNENKKIMCNIFKSIKPINPATIIIVITNPLDHMTFLAQSLSELPTQQVFGSGTFLDTLRLKTIIAEKIEIAPESVQAYIIGEHGDSQVIAWSCTEIAGTPIAQFSNIHQKDLDHIAQQVKDKAYDIIACKGSTHFGIATCVAALCEAIIFNQRIVIPLSTYIKEYNVVFSMPVILGENGIEKILSLPLNDIEQKKLRQSTDQLRSLLQELEV